MTAAGRCDGCERDELARLLHERSPVRRSVELACRNTWRVCAGPQRLWHHNYITGEQEESRILTAAVRRLRGFTWSNQHGCSAPTFSNSLQIISRLAVGRASYNPVSRHRSRRGFAWSGTLQSWRTEKPLQLKAGRMACLSTLSERSKARPLHAYPTALVRCS